MSTAGHHENSKGRRTPRRRSELAIAAVARNQSSPWGPERQKRCRPAYARPVPTPQSSVDGSSSGPHHHKLDLVLSPPSLARANASAPGFPSQPAAPRERQTCALTGLLNTLARSQTTNLDAVGGGGGADAGQGPLRPTQSSSGRAGAMAARSSISLTTSGHNGGAAVLPASSGAVRSSITITSSGAMVPPAAVSSTGSVTETLGASLRKPSYRSTTGGGGGGGLDGVLSVLRTISSSSNGAVALPPVRRAAGGPASRENSSAGAASPAAFASPAKGGPTSGSLLQAKPTGSSSGNVAQQQRWRIPSADQLRMDEVLPPLQLQALQPSATCGLDERATALALGQRPAAHRAGMQSEGNLQLGAGGAAPRHSAPGLRGPSAVRVPQSLLGASASSSGVAGGARAALGPYSGRLGSALLLSGDVREATVGQRAADARAPGVADLLQLLRCDDDGDDEQEVDLGEGKRLGAILG